MSELQAGIQGEFAVMFCPRLETYRFESSGELPHEVQGLFEVQFEPRED